LLSIYLNLNYSSFIYIFSFYSIITIFSTLFTLFILWILDKLNSLITSNTLTVTILSSTSITKLMTTSTCHMIASLIFFYKKFTLKTLFEFFSFYKLFKSHIILISCIRYLKLFTCLSFMPSYTTIQTITIKHNCISI